jgi:hypothetical protein
MISPSIVFCDTKLGRGEKLEGMLDLKNTAEFQRWASSGFCQWLNIFLPLDEKE